MRWKTSVLALALFLLVSFFIVGIARKNNDLAVDLKQKEELQTMSFVMYKDPDCSCCDLYAEILKSKLGLNLKVEKTKNLFDVKNKYKIQPKMQSCHTLLADNGKFIEGHVPLSEFVKFMTTESEFVGISLPGMYPGTPGMPGEKISDYELFGIYKSGEEKFIKSI